METDDPGDDQPVPEIPGRADGFGFGAIQRGESIFCEFGRHDRAERPCEFDPDAEWGDASRGWNAAAEESVLDGGAAGGFAEAGGIAEGGGAGAGHAEGAARGADCGRIVPRAGAVCARRGGRHYGGAGWGEHPGGGAAAWGGGTGGRGRCDELQDPDTAEIFERGG